MVLEFLCTHSPSHLPWLLLTLYTPPAGAFTCNLVCSWALGCDFQVKCNCTKEPGRVRDLGAEGSVAVIRGRDWTDWGVPSACCTSVAPGLRQAFGQKQDKSSSFILNRTRAALHLPSSTQVFASGHQSIFASVRRHSLTRLEYLMFDLGSNIVFTLFFKLLLLFEAGIFIWHLVLCAGNSQNHVFFSYSNSTDVQPTPVCYWYW